MEARTKSGRHLRRTRELSKLRRLLSLRRTFGGEGKGSLASRSAFWTRPYQNVVAVQSCATSGMGRCCRKSRKSKDPENIAKVVSLLLQGPLGPIRGRTRNFQDHVLGWSATSGTSLRLTWSKVSPPRRVDSCGVHAEALMLLGRRRLPMHLEPDVPQLSDRCWSGGSAHNC